MVAAPGPVLVRLCGKVVNESAHTLVAASRDKSGGDCPPVKGRCGTCDVPPGQDSVRACSRVFEDTDLFTFDHHDFYVDGKHYPAHHYVEVDGHQKVVCKGSDRIDCRIQHPGEVRPEVPPRLAG